jgi:hypothetical protein
VLTSPQALALGRSLPASQFAGTLFIVLGKAVTCQWNRLGHIKRTPAIQGIVVGILTFGLSRLLLSPCSNRLVGKVIAINLIFDGFPQGLRCSH